MGFGLFAANFRGWAGRVVERAAERERRGAVVESAYTIRTLDEARRFGRSCAIWALATLVMACVILVVI